ncbi:MAG: CUB domain-containing protein, partial [Bacteroidota bacterium]|nr:CUB domain-containing protein [Bacteroidota bacterium]
MKKIFLVSVILLSFFSLYSQNITMSSGSTITYSCSGGNFYDPGGTGNYANNSNFTQTICAPAGQYLIFNFTQFNTESNWDFLNIYNGPSTSSPLLGTYSGTSSPGIISTTFEGCLTFVFTSDGSVNYSGWTAGLSCSTSPPPPPPPNPGTCASAQPFCTSTGVTFPASTNTTAPTGPNYGCLFSQPNPAWYYLNVATAGNIDITLTNSANADIDFIAWGPFANQGDMCTSIFGGAASFDCSYSSSSTEYVNIVGALPGQWYMVLITNFSNQATNVVATQSGGSGTTNCNILCNMISLTANPNPCDPLTGEYSVSGQISFQYPPTSGTLTVSSSCGNSINIPSPWTSPISYTLPGITATGGGCNLTAAFSADPTCTLTVPYTSPAPCISSCTLTAGNNGPVCSGSLFNLTTTPVSGATYSWTGPNGFTSNLQNPTGVGAGFVSGTYTYSVTATDGISTCTSSTTVTVNPTPTVFVNNQSVCSGQSATLTAVPSILGGTFLWSPGNETTSSITDSPLTTSTYSVVYTLNGCSGTTNGEIIVTSQPTITLNDTTICQGDTLELIPIVSEPNGNYSWNTSDITPTITVFPSTTTVYEVIYSISGCLNDTATAIVTVNPK